MRAAPRTLIFLHIPKTGGTTFRRILKHNYSSRETLTFTGSDYSVAIDRFAKSPERTRARYRLVQGHLYFGFHRFILGECNYVTWIRDPMARVLSFYSHVRSRSDHYLHRRLMEERLDLKDLIKRDATPELFDLQTRMIAGVPNDPNLPVDRQALETAKKNLSADTMLFGLTEEFDARLVMLGQLLGWDVPCYVRTNVGSERIDPGSVDPETRRMIQESNSLDFELYKFAQTIFEARLRSAGADFEEKLARFQELNSARSGARRKNGRMKSMLKNLRELRGNSEQLTVLKESAAAGFTASI